MLSETTSPGGAITAIRLVKKPNAASSTAAVAVKLCITAYVDRVSGIAEVEVFTLQNKTCQRKDWEDHKSLCRVETLAQLSMDETEIPRLLTHASSAEIAKLGAADLLKENRLTFRITCQFGRHGPARRYGLKYDALEWVHIDQYAEGSALTEQLNGIEPGGQFTDLCLMFVDASDESIRHPLVISLYDHGHCS